MRYAGFFMLCALAGGVLFGRIDTAEAATNLVANPSLENSVVSGTPDSWSRGRWGTNTAVFAYPVAGFTGSRAARVQLTGRTSGDAKWWFNEVPVTPGTPMRFADSYNSTVQTWVTVQYRLSNGSFIYQDLGSLPSSGGTWQNSSFDFKVPSGAVSLTVFHLINAVGSLTVDNFSLTSTASMPTGIISLNFDDGWKTTYQNALPILNAAGYKGTWYIVTGRFNFPAYLDAAQVLSLQAAGQEVGAHTRTHANLTTLSLADAQKEVGGSLDDLHAIGVRDVPTFSYPYGSYNSTLKTLVRSDGFMAARSSDGGFDSRTSDFYALARQPVDKTTSVAQIQAWIDTAMKNDLWLILVFHHVDLSGETTSITPADFQQIIDYLKAKNARVMPMKEALTALQK